MGNYTADSGSQYVLNDNRGQSIGLTDYIGLHIRGLSCNDLMALADRGTNCHRV